MRLSEVVNQFKARGREVFNFVSHPDEVIRRIARRRAQQMYEQVEIGGSDRKQSSKQDRPRFPTLSNPFQDNNQNETQVEATVQSQPVQTQIETQIQPTLKPRINRERGGVQTRIQPTLLDSPILTERSRRRRKDKTQKVLVQGHEIRDTFGVRYQIGQCLSHSAQIRQYEAIPLSQQKQRVFIQEYLTRSDSDHLPEVNAQNGKVKEFRLLTPLDVFPDFYEDNSQDIRWYSIVEKLPKSLTLREYLQQRSQLLTPTQVSKIMQQVLQTLEYLHNCYEVRLSDTVRKGMGHGNLNLDSLLIIPNATQSLLNEEDEHFSIYVSRMALWEQLIDTLEINHPCLSKETAIPKDLKDLGKVSYLLSGGQQENPDQDSEWHQYCHPELKNFTLQLYSGSFKRSSDAHKELLKLTLDHAVQPAENVFLEEDEPTSEEETQRSWIIPIVILLATLISLGVSLFGIRQFLSSRSKPVKPVNIEIHKASNSTQISQVKIPQSLVNKAIKYSADKRWENILDTSVWYRFNQSQFHQMLKNQSLLNLQSPNLFYLGRPENNSETNEQKKQRLENQVLSTLTTSDFIVVSVFGDELHILQESEQLEVDIIAYDALLAYVAFSDVKEDGSLPKRLSGQISLETLKQLYSNPNFTENLVIADSLEVSRNPICDQKQEDVFLVRSFFENLALESEEEISNFRKLIEQDNNACKKTGYDKGTARALAKYQQKDRKAVIGIDLFSKVFNQCSVYPLAIVGKEKLKAVQPIIQNNGRPITPETDLCMDKGSYRPNPKIFERGDYPLGYAIAVIYNKDNAKYSAGRVFSRLMKTDEGQHLLESAGLIPIRDLK